jgi:hypothetical protein
MEDIKIAKYLEIDLITLRNMLLNKYSKNNSYEYNIDYIKIKNHMMDLHI